MCIMPRAAPVCMCALRMRVGQMSEISQSSSTTMVESNMKSEHNLYLEKRCWNILGSWWNILGAGGDVSEDVGTYLELLEMEWNIVS